MASNPHPATVETGTKRLVGSDRVLAVLVALAERPEGATLDQLTQAVDSPKSTVHRALASLRRANFAAQLGRGLYVVGDEFVRLALENQAARPERLAIEPVLRRLSERFDETAHYAVLDGTEVVYRAKVDPASGSVRLTSVIGGRNPAYRTAVGKLLLSRLCHDRGELAAVVGRGPFAQPTANTIGTLDGLWHELEVTRDRGWASDDQENELGINCIAVPGRFGPGGAVSGAVSVSALAFRRPLKDLIDTVGEIRTIVDGPSTGATGQ
ncbi:IclR family transcriptional regulator [Leifsonia poae]|uniref:IclR family transcriptional regulator n=1 Tax=Leifsonia poae TaxID=110933 RepID=UPI001CBCA1C4|nr:IclR family transcriptional regulator [Leifsonia poae]